MGRYGRAGIRCGGCIEQSAWGLEYRAKKGKGSDSHTLCLLPFDYIVFQYVLYKTMRDCKACSVKGCSPIILPLYIVQKQGCFCPTNPINFVNFFKNQFI